MATVRAFRGVRFTESAGSDLGRLIAPPYDVTLPDLVPRMRALSPFNMVHLEHAAPGAAEDHHDAAARRYRDWLRRDVLRRDSEPALYLYDHAFTVDGETHRRRGILTAVRLAAWDERVVLPHEETFPGPKLERLRRLRAVRANLSPLYFLYRDPASELRALLAAAGNQPADVMGRDPSGDEHRLTVLRDPDLIDRVGAFFASRRLYVADGHHRYEAAHAYRDERRAESGPVPSPEPDGNTAYEYVLALLADADDPGVLVLPTHRLLIGLPNFDPARIRAQLGDVFDLDNTPDSRFATPPLFDRSTIALIRFTGETGSWRLRAKPETPHLNLMPADRGPAWRALDVAVLDTVLERILGIPRDRLFDHISFRHDTETALTAIDRGEAQIAFLLKPSSVDSLIAVADGGDKMPAKSTYFYPKVPAGLVIHDLT